MPRDRSANPELIRSALFQLAPAFNVRLEPAVTDRIIEYCRLLMRWNRRFSLVSFSSAEDLVQFHLLESLYLKRWIDPVPESIVDIGSGAGLPGILLALMMPETRIHLIESNKKRSVFLGEAARTLGIPNIRVFEGRYEAFDAGIKALIVARALECMLEEIPNITEHFKSALGFRFLLAANSLRYLRLPSDRWELATHGIPMSKERVVLEVKRIGST